jgi:hypothetical protein
LDLLLTELKFKTMDKVKKEEEYCFTRRNFSTVIMIMIDNNSFRRTVYLPHACKLH